MRARAWLWPGVAVFVLGTLVAQWLSAQTSGGGMFVRTAYAAGAWWQLLSGQWVHFGYLHALANAAAAVVVALTLQGWVSPHRLGLALLGGYAGVAAALAWDSHCAVYAGASGALHGMLAGGALALWLSPSTTVTRSHPWQGRLLAAALLVGLGIKMLVQHLLAAPGEPGWLGIATYYPAHEAGASGGMVALLLAYGWSRLHRASPEAKQQEK